MRVEWCSSEQVRVVKISLEVVLEELRVFDLGGRELLALGSHTGRREGEAHHESQHKWSEGPALGTKLSHLQRVRGINTG